MRHAVRLPLPVLSFLCAVLPAQTPRLLLDGVPGPGSSMRYAWGIARSPRASEAFLVLADAAHGAELWRTDGTTAGTRLVVDLTPGPASTAFVDLNTTTDGLWILCRIATRLELWRSDGTAAGTVLVLARPDTGLSPLSVPLLQLPDGDVIVAIDRVLWRTDGTPGGTFSLGIPVGYPVDLGRGRFYVRTWDTFEVWSSDGTMAGTVRESAGVIGSALAFGGLVIAEASAPGQTTLRTLGVSPAPSAVVPEWAAPFAIQGGLAVIGDSTLWSWDGGVTPRVLRRFASLARSPLGNTIAAAGGGVLFTADDGTHGHEPWWADLTTTHLLGDLTPGLGSTPIANGALVMHDRCVFWADVGGAGNEPWVSDGTPAGTTPLGDLEPGPGSSVPDLISNASTLVGTRRAVIPITTSATGTELWITDGTAAGTRLLADLNPGPASSIGFPWWASHAGNTLIWGALEPGTGFEPRALDLEGARSELLGGCSVAARYRVEDPVLGAVWRLAVTGLAPPRVGAAFLAAPATTPIPLGGGCLLQLDLATLVTLAPIVPDATGRWAGSILVPNVPSLRGVRLVTQAAFAPSTHPLGVTMADAWYLTLGS